MDTGHQYLDRTLDRVGFGLDKHYRSRARSLRSIRAAIRAALTAASPLASLRRMEQLYAPWRIQYIRAPKPPPGDTSIFTQIAQSSNDLGNNVICRERTSYAVLNNFPYNAGHTLIVPYRQVPDLQDLTNEEMLELMQLTRRVQAALQKAMKPDGFNIGLNLGQSAGAGIREHLHIHIVPRWHGDTNFMPVLGQTNVLPQALAELAAEIRSALNP
jgi:ATP adenylyltransferase